MALLKMGSKGEEVKKLQERLNELGYDCGKPDGIFGIKTQTAVQKLQKEYNLVVDGIVGYQTNIILKDLQRLHTLQTKSSDVGIVASYLLEE